MDYIDPAQARHLSGLRLALTCHVPAPYSMSARAIFDLRAWTVHRDAPVAVYNDEAPRVGWLDILNLAERLGRGPRPHA